MTPADFLAHARYYHRASIVIPFLAWLAFQIGYWIPDGAEVEA
ncbi:MAG: hypothetical protein JWQ01_4849 [Massilia sp.]|nr:hypothetical protein [Massilia sp.]